MANSGIRTKPKAFEGAAVTQRIETKNSQSQGVRSIQKSQTNQTRDRVSIPEYLIRSPLETTPN